MSRRWLLVAALLSGCVTPAVLPNRAIPLAYMTMADVSELPALPECIELESIEVADARGNEVIGKRFIEGGSGPVADVTATTDVSVWVRTGAEQIAKTCGVSLGAKGAPRLRMTVHRITMMENVYRRAGYEAHIAIDAELLAADGHQCWEGHAERSASNWGYEGTVENYQETLNHALDRTVAELIGSLAFERAVCRTCREETLASR